MKSKSSKTILYLFFILLVMGVVYTACKDIKPNQEVVETKVELKLAK